jgi:hypothetical protein
MIAAVIGIACLLSWLGAGLATLTYLAYAKGIHINGPLHSLSIIVIWPIYLIFTP